MKESEVKEIIEYVNDTSVSDHYGKWGALNREQRKKIRDLCNSWLIINEHDEQMTKFINELEQFINNFSLIVEFGTDKLYIEKSILLNKIKELKGEKWVKEKKYMLYTRAMII